MVSSNDNSNLEISNADDKDKAVMTGCIYLITCLPTGKTYVGSTQRLLKGRWREHRKALRVDKHNNMYLQHAFNKYGEEQFTCTVLEEWVGERKVGFQRESFWIEQLQPAFNIADVNPSGKQGGHPVSEETKEKLRKINLGHSASQETRKRQSLAQTGRKHSQTTLEKMSKSQQGKKRTPEQKEHLRQMNLGKTISSETREKISKAHKGIPKSQEHRKKIGLGNLGRKMSSLTKEKLLLANLGKCPTTETREKLSKAHLGKKFSPEHREKIRQATLGHTVTQETKEKISAARRGKPGHPTSETTREKLRQSHLNRTPEEVEVRVQKMLETRRRNKKAGGIAK